MLSGAGAVASQLTCHNVDANRVKSLCVLKTVISSIKYFTCGV
jgi:hypothetical protein